MTRVGRGMIGMGALHSIGRHIAYQRHLAGLLGWRQALRFRGAALGARARLHGRVVRLHPPNLLHPVDLRLGSTDAKVYGQVLTRQEYAPVALAAARVIVDCGANIGLTSAYLLSRCPEARVIAIEPFAANARMCRRNLAAYGSRATVIEAAVWSRCTRLALDYTEGSEWGVRVRPARPGERGDIQAIDLPSLGLERIDILKIDIEGSEAELFAEGADRWLPRVANIAIELHGSTSERRFWAAMAAYRYDLSCSSELTVCRNIAPAAPADGRASRLP
jgi:FkbM family methyltransferase